MKINMTRTNILILFAVFILFAIVLSSFYQLLIGDDRNEL